MRFTPFVRPRLFNWTGIETGSRGQRERRRDAGAVAFAKQEDTCG
jgi:hypothetical protein